MQLVDCAFGQNRGVLGHQTHHQHTLPPIQPNSTMSFSPKKRAADSLPLLFEYLDAKEEKGMAVKRVTAETGVSEAALYKAYQRSPEREKRGKLSQKLSNE